MVQFRGGSEFQTGGILQYFEELKRGTNKEIGPKDIFEIASKYLLGYSMTFKQLTVLTGNSVSQLNDVLSFLGGGDVNMRAHCLVDNGDGYCKLRMVVSEPDRAVEILQAKKLTAVVNDVVLVETDDKPGGLSRLLKMLENNDIQIDYSYTAANQTPGIATMVFRFSDNMKAVKILETNGLKLIKSDR